MRKAAAGWEEEYAGKLSAAGFARGVAAPTVFYNPLTKVKVVVHGDDFTFAGVEIELRNVRTLLESWWDVKFRGIMGSNDGDIKEVTILGRILRWTANGLEY